MVEDKMSTSYLSNGPILHPSPNYQANNLQLRTPQIFQFTNMKQEPVDDEKIDSGINSGGSDFQSSSPGSDQSSSDHYINNNQPQYFSTPKIAQFPTFPQHLQSQQHQQQQPLTPPNSEPLISPKSGDCDDTTLTPCSSPGTLSNHDDCEIGNISDNNNDIKVPKINNNSGKTKFMKCKQCKFICTTKEVFWDHMKVHIREDKRLSCTQCNFITEYKHHLEYHLRNHAGSKPFKCPNCNYTCVNKSMLNSHMKSHSNIYQYHCADCNYATKYCHSLKLHLRKHRHQPGIVLDQEGKPNPLPIIDVYGTRRGPKMKPKGETTQDKQQTSKQQETPNLPPPPPPFIPPQLSLAFSFLNQFPNHDMAAHLNQLMLERQLAENDTETEDIESEIGQGVLDLSQPSTSTTTTNTAATTTTTTGQTRNRRKGPAFKLMKTDQESDNEIEINTEIKEENNNETKIDDFDEVQKNNNNDNNRCSHCDMAFGDQVLYTLHMSLHGKNDPFMCNACGIKCENRIAFYVHITRYAH